jgi:hypothetical protein|tara:strand:- start:354 stop:701 length:348 start_codon:yes stop_codon:yes gene_type:complete
LKLLLERHSFLPLHILDILHFHHDPSLVISKVFIGPSFDQPQSFILLAVSLMVLESLLEIGFQNLDSFLHLIQSTLERFLLKGFDMVDALTVFFVISIFQVLAPLEHYRFANMVN